MTSRARCLFAGLVALAVMVSCALGSELDQSQRQLAVSPGPSTQGFEHFGYGSCTVDGNSPEGPDRVDVECSPGEFTHLIAHNYGPEVCRATPLTLDECAALCDATDDCAYFHINPNEWLCEFFNTNINGAYYGHDNIHSRSCYKKGASVPDTCATTLDSSASQGTPTLANIAISGTNLLADINVPWYADRAITSVSFGTCIDSGAQATLEVLQNYVEDASVDPGCYRSVRLTVALSDVIASCGVTSTSNTVNGAPVVVFPTDVTVLITDTLKDQLGGEGGLEGVDIPVTRTTALPVQVVLPESVEASASVQAENAPMSPPTIRVTVEATMNSDTMSQQQIDAIVAAIQSALGGTAATTISVSGTEVTVDVAFSSEAAAAAAASSTTASALATAIADDSAVQTAFSGESASFSSTFEQFDAQVSVSFVISAQSFDTATKTVSLTVTASAVDPFTIKADPDPVLSTNVPTVSVSAADPTDNAGLGGCGETGACYQDVALTINANTACSVDGSYTLTLGVGCRGSGACSIGDSATATLELTITVGTDLCAIVDAEAAGNFLTAELGVYGDATLTQTKLLFIQFSTAYFKFTVSSTGGDNLIESVTITDVDWNSNRILYAGGSATALGTSNALQINDAAATSPVTGREVNFNHVISLGSDADADLLDLAESASGTFTVTAKATVAYATGVRRELAVAGHLRPAGRRRLETGDAASSTSVAVLKAPETAEAESSESGTHNVVMVGVAGVALAAVVAATVLAVVVLRRRGQPKPGPVMELSSVIAGTPRRPSPGATTVSSSTEHET